MEEENKVDSSSERIIDVRELRGEFDDSLPPANPDRVTIEIADFADSLAISYKDISIHFNMAQMNDPYKLVKELVDSFDGVTRTR